MPWWYWSKWASAYITLHTQLQLLICMQAHYRKELTVNLYQQFLEVLAAPSLVAIAICWILPVGGHPTHASALFNNWPIRFAGSTEHVLAYLTNQIRWFCCLNTRATRESLISAVEKLSCWSRLTCGSYPFSGSPGASYLQLYTVMMLLWEQETPQDNAECRGTTTVDHTKERLLRSCTWKDTVTVPSALLS